MLFVAEIIRGLTETSKHFTTKTNFNKIGLLSAQKDDYAKSIT